MRLVALALNLHNPMHLSAGIRPGTKTDHREG